MASSPAFDQAQFIEDLIDLEVPAEVCLSPSGEHVVYTVSTFGQKEEHKIASLWTAQVGLQDSALQVTSGSSHDRLPQWSPTGETVAFLSDRRDRGKSCAIYLLPTGRGEAYAVTNPENLRNITTFAWSPDGKFIAYLSADEKTAKKREDEDAELYGADWQFNRLRLLHVATRTVTILCDKAAHVTKLAWSADSKQIAYVLQDTPEIDSAGYNGVSFEMSSVLNKGNTFISRFPGPVNGQIVYSLSTKDRKWSKHAHGQEDCAATLSCTHGLFTVKVKAGLSDEIRLGNDTVIFPDEHEIKDWDVVETKKGDYVLSMTKSSISRPAEVYSLTVSREERGKAGKLVRLTSHNRTIARLNLSTAQAVRCDSADGTTALEGLFLSPSKSSADETPVQKPLPTAVLIHGGPYDRTTTRFDTAYYRWSPLLLSTRNNGILMPNYRGGSGRGEAFAAYARGRMGTVDYDDVISLVDEGIRSGLVDRHNIVVGGWSQGGFLSYLMAVWRSGSLDGSKDDGKSWKIKGAICGAGVTDWDMMSMTSDFPWSESELAGGAPWEVEDEGVDTIASPARW
ncbi:hypothetical protein B0A49_11331 [Cryomyces minteri]|uniref:Dipeptidyl-peptidase V n=1 Tax=Cryomyces minteri TaxID=331657 RepID=A0A4U0WCE7_9PEZI|nr:hypothetical protein B0A49_11331 [Cryomyces minteri]